MNFYVSTAQLLQTIEGLEKNLDFLAERAFRISPRDSRANREILEQCASKMAEAKGFLEGNAHISKISLRHAALLLQIFRLSFRRMDYLAAAVADLKGESEDEARTIQSLFAAASHHFRLLKQVLSGLAGIPLILEIEGPDPQKSGDPGLFQTEENHHRELLTLLEKTVEIFDEEPELLDALVFIRQELLESRKRLRRSATPAAVQKAGTPSPAFSPK